MDAILIVVGAHLDAEVEDRPLAYHLAAALRERAGARRVIVATDLWVLNQREWQGARIVSVGRPQVNAMTAYLAGRLPSVFAVDGRLMVQMDLESGEALAACWGMDQESTAAAVEAFMEKYLEHFASACG